MRSQDWGHVPETALHMDPQLLKDQRKTTDIIPSPNILFLIFFKKINK